MKAHTLTLWPTTAAAMLLTAGTLTAAPIIEYLEKFDDDPVGLMPPGWVHTGEASNTAVTNLASVSPNNSFMIDHNGSSATFYAAQNRYSFTGINFNASTPTVFYQFDFNVAFLGGGSEGFDFRLWSDNSQIDRGAFRIFKLSATTYAINAYAGSGTIATLNMNQWYNLRVEFDPTNTTDGQARWYLNGSSTPFHVQNWSGLALSQTQNIHVFDIREIKQSVGGSGSRIYLDNFTIAIPEPVSAASLGVGGLLAALRRRNTRAVS